MAEEATLPTLAGHLKIEFGANVSAADGVSGLTRAPIGPSRAGSGPGLVEVAPEQEAVGDRHGAVTCANAVAQAGVAVRARH